VGVGGGGGLKTDKGGGGSVTGMDERLEGGWGTASAHSSSRGDDIGKSSPRGWWWTF
jgi:hypothetical protein